MSDTFCPIPWNHQSVRTNGDLRFCSQGNNTVGHGTLHKTDGTTYNAGRDTLADARNSPLLKELRVNMLRGTWHTACARCQSEEAAGLPSKRIFERDQWPEVDPLLVAENTAADGTIDTAALPAGHYDLRFGNLCNLACRMCGPQDSTGWYDDYHRMENISSFEDTHGTEQMYKVHGKWVSDSYGWHGSETFWQQIEANAHNLRHVYMAGGEPLLIERHYEFLERCITNGSASQILLDYNTNMTSIPNRVLKLWSHFKTVQIGASIDGYGAVLEYQRYPVSWDKVLHNIRKVDEAAANIRAWFAYTVTAYNVLHMPDFMRWKLSDSQLIKFNSSVNKPIVTHHVLHGPKWLSIRTLPAAYKSLVAERFAEFHNWMSHSSFPDHVKHSSNRICTSITNHMMVHDYHTEHWAKFRSFTNQLDQLRGQRLADVVPELGAYL